MMDAISTLEEVHINNDGSGSGSGIAPDADFKVRINEAFEYCSELRKGPWREVERVAQLCISEPIGPKTRGGGGGGTLRIEGVVACPADRLEHALMDTHYSTRSQWDTTVLKSLNPCERYSDIYIVERADHTGALLTSRVHHGVEAWWSRYNNKTRAYSCIQCTVAHPVFRPDATQKQRTIQTSIYIRAIDSGEHHCYISLILREDAKYTLEMQRRERVLTRLLQCVETCATPAAYTKIYDRWRCSCECLNDAYLLECRKCTLARYWKCFARGCRRSQPSSAADATECVYCDASRE